MTLLVRLIAGLAIALSIAYASRRARSLSSGGAIAAIVVGATSIAAGWSWGGLLIAFFVASTALSHYRAPVKTARTASIVAKGSERDAKQVLANGGVFALAAALSLLAPSWLSWPALAAGALAASTSDTWATEIGTLSNSTPRTIVGWRQVPPGTSGGVTGLGALAAIAGAAFIALVALAVGWPRDIPLAALFGGIFGSTVDSLIGATLQSRRWCDLCDRPTERAIHGCGMETRAAGGIAWLDNDVVNLLSSAAGGLLAALVAG
jgi:uncharacterized protein (TIGR00297 family)